MRAGERDARRSRGRTIDPELPLQDRRRGKRDIGDTGAE
jgi:hypothetical protein